MQRSPGDDAWRVVACIAIGLGLLLLIPGLGPVLAWPWLFVVPGTLLVSRAVPGLTPPGKVGAGIVASVLVSAHLTWRWWHWCGAVRRRGGCSAGGWSPCLSSPTWSR
ncbi:MAG: hypothetical protein ABI352_06875 [Candidatus Dormibacter sp.]